MNKAVLMCWRSMASYHKDTFIYDSQPVTFLNYVKLLYPSSLSVSFIVRGIKIVKVPPQGYQGEDPHSTMKIIKWL